MTAQSASSVALDELNLVIHTQPGPEALTLTRQCLPNLEPVIRRAVDGDAAALKEARAAVLQAHTQATKPRGFGRQRRQSPEDVTKAAADAKAAAEAKAAAKAAAEAKAAADAKAAAEAKAAAPSK